MSTLGSGAALVVFLDATQGGVGSSRWGPWARASWSCAPKAQAPGWWWPCGSHVVNAYPPGCSERLQGGEKSGLSWLESMEVTGPPGPLTTALAGAGTAATCL